MVEVQQARALFTATHAAGHLAMMYTLDKCGNTLCNAHCRDLPLLERVVLESLRLRPPAYMVGRCAAQADVLAGYSVRQGDAH